MQDDERKSTNYLDMHRSFHQKIVSSPTNSLVLQTDFGLASLRTIPPLFIPAFMISMLAALLFPALLCPSSDSAFSRDFRDETLRVDYAFSGCDTVQQIAVEELRRGAGWFGRRTHMDSLLLSGNGEIVMRDATDGRVLYKTSFSTLFQEWQTTEEATRVHRSFENVFLLPMPRRNAEITVSLFDTRHRLTQSLRHEVRPDDILIRPLSNISPYPHRVLHQGGIPQKSIDVAIVAEGYRAEEMELFYQDARRTVDELLSYAPYSEMKDRWNFTAVAPPSAETGVSVPHDNDWKQTVLGAHFDTFYSARYLTTPCVRKLHDVLAGIPYEHIIVLVNTDRYGGGGIYNSYTLVAAHHPLFRPVVVHEFGHSFAGLADEYFYDDQYTPYYHADVEPWELNITTLANFGRKWRDLLPADAAIPTPPQGLPATDMTRMGVYEGAGYQSKGVYRAFQDCRMRTNEAPAFCAVCRRATRQVIQYHTEE